MQRRNLSSLRELLKRWIVQRNLWIRLVLGVNLSFLVLFAAFSVLGELALRDSSERIMSERQVIAQITAANIDDRLRQAIANLEQARRFTDFTSASPDPQATSLLLEHRYSQAGLFTGGMIFLDQSGSVIEAYPVDRFAHGANLASLPFVAEALQLRQATISAPFPDPQDGQPLTAVSVPILDGDRLRGILCGLINLNGPGVRSTLIQAATLEQSGHAVLFDSEGRTLSSTYPVAPFSPGEHGTFFNRVLSAGHPMVATVPFELNLPGEPLGHMHVMAAANLQMAPWGVAIGGDLDETFVGVSRLRMGLIGLAIIALVVTSGVTLVGARLLVAPVQRLTDAAQRIAAGDLRMPLHAAEGGEIGAMATALEHMRRQLLDNIDDLAQLNTTLETRVATRTEELGQQRALAQQLLHRAIAAQEEERARLAHELHDEIGQMLTAVQLSLDRLGKALPAESDVARERLGQVRSLTTQTLSDLRRVIADLRPGILDQLGLAPALDWVGEHTLRPLGLSVTVETQIAQKRLPPAVETILFRIAQEAMHNVARHSGANHLQVSLISTEHDVHLTLVDDGRGFSPSDIAAPFDHGRGLGLAGMHERASLVGGRLEIKSAPGRGTTIHVIIPLPASSEEGLKT